MNPKLLFASILYFPDSMEWFFENLIGSEKDVLIVLNCKMDELSRMIVDANNWKIIQNHKNLGFTNAANQILQYAMHHKYDYVCLFNQDVKLIPFQIEELVSMFNDKSDVGIISPFLIDKHGNTEYHLSKLLKKGIYLQKKPYVSFIHAACWILSMNVVKKVGLFNSIFFNYGQDLDYCNRLNFLDYKIAVIEDIAVVHDKIAGDYELTLRKNCKVHTGYIFAKIINPVSPISPFKMCIKTIGSSVWQAVRFNFRKACIEFYAVISIAFYWRKLKYSYESEFKQVVSK